LTEEEILEETQVEDPVAPPVDIETTTTEEDGVTVNVTIQQPAPENIEEDLVEGEDIPTEIIPEPSTFMLTSPVVLADPEYSDVPSVMADVVVSVLGEYQRITYTTEEYDVDGNLVSVSTEYVPGLAGLDYAWITGAILFGILVAGCLKLLGGLIRS
jgi:hypothetical protein